MKFLDARVGIALGVLISLVALFWVIRGEFTGEVDEPFRIERVADLERIELMPPTGSDRAELIALERRDDHWWMVRPREVRLDDEHARQFSDVFGHSIGTDDLTLDIERARSYGLDDEQSVRVALFGAGDDQAARQFLVGDQLDIPQTGARRTFIKQPDGDAIYRAQAGFGNLVRLPVSELQDATITVVGQEGIEAIRLRHHDGHHLQLAFSDGEWSFAGDSPPEYGVDEQVSTRLAATVGQLSASRATDISQLSADDVGLQQPDVVIEIQTGTQDIHLEVSAHRGRPFVRRVGQEEFFVVDQSIGRLLQSTAGDLRDRRLIDTDVSIEALELVDDSRLAIDGGEWTFTGRDGDAIDTDAVRRLVDTITGLRVERWDLTASGDDIDFDAGHTIGFDFDGRTEYIDIGPPVGDRSAAHYGRHSETDGIFIISRSTVRQLQSTTEQLTDAP